LLSVNLSKYWWIYSTIPLHPNPFG